MTVPRIAIIGAGMAGLACATELAKHGHAAKLYDKGRGPGGRMATRRAELGEAPGGETLRFDHGAQYFTARDPAFIAAVEGWVAKGAAAKWPAAGEEAFVGTPGMNAPLQHMAASQDVSWATRIVSIERSGSFWRVFSDAGAEEFSHILIAIPAEQAAELLKDIAPDYAAKAGNVVSNPCWAAMASFERPVPIAADTIRSRDGKISWAARNSAKPGRSGPESWVIHASPEYSREILELDKDVAAPLLMTAFFAQAEIAEVTAQYLTAHRWRFAQVGRAAGASDPAPALWDTEARIGVAGDWLVEPRVEGAWLSGTALAGKVIGSL